MELTFMLQSYKPLHDLAGPENVLSRAYKQLRQFYKKKSETYPSTPI